MNASGTVYGDMLEPTAAAFAAHWHGVIGHRRRYTGEPYIVHPCSVAQRVRYTDGCTREMLALAWLHDVLEDTPCPPDLLRFTFGPYVADLVDMLTFNSKHLFPHANRAERKAMDREFIARALPEAKTVKALDRLDNIESIVEQDRDFARVFIPETKLLLLALEGADTGALHNLRAVVEKAERHLA